MNAAAFALSPESLNPISFVQALTSKLLAVNRNDPKRLQYLNEFRVNLAADPGLLTAAEASLSASLKFTDKVTRISEFATFGWNSNVSGFIQAAAAAAAAAASESAY